MGPRDISSSSTNAKASGSAICFTCSVQLERWGLTCGYSHPLAFTPLEMLTFCTLWDSRQPVDSVASATITEHILAFKCWLPADSQSDSYANESTMTGVIKSWWLFRELMVEHNDPVKWLSPLQFGGRCMWTEGGREAGGELSVTVHNKKPHQQSSL